LKKIQTTSSNQQQTSRRI